MDEQYSNIPLDYATPNLSYPEERRGINLVKELSPQEHLREMMAWLNGKVWDEKKKMHIEIPGVKPFMNEEGRNMFFHMATSIISPLVTMSNYTTNYRMIHALTMMHVKRAIVHFHLHYKDYGITRKTQITIVGDKLMTLGLSCFYKAIGAGDRKAATSNIHESISNISRSGFEGFSQPTKKMGILSRMNPFAR
jgi:hypothetical protein